jgi:hypothetical protein
VAFSNPLPVFPPFFHRLCRVALLALTVQTHQVDNFLVQTLEVVPLVFIFFQHQFQNVVERLHFRVSLYVFPALFFNKFLMGPTLTIQVQVSFINGELSQRTHVQKRQSKGVNVHLERVKKLCAQLVFLDGF